LKVNDALSGAGLAALGGVVLWHVQSFPAMPGQKFGPAWFPGLIAIGLLACGVVLMLRAAQRIVDLQATWPGLLPSAPRRGWRPMRP
jgi:putative tricarboxylic transport membrane protein